MKTVATRNEHARPKRRKRNAKPHWFGYHPADDFSTVECLGSYDVKDCFFSSVGERLKTFDRS
ncbi:hypothetical protein BJF91_02275 [Allorhizobium taibaishanense]|uniref:Uncharacterized protein n=1 Tax=Allorhizobium taibaishanense TaxID=887144 RepID=A0A1Q9ABX8_9HYPH|nr:hypothetical protein BJF91_02275 [Allorhizobium taibaishanense]